MRVPKHLQLLLSGVVVLLAGLVYGINPSKIVPFVLGFEVEVLELKNIFRAIMGIYLGLGIFLLIGAFNEKLWRPDYSLQCFVYGRDFFRTDSKSMG